MCLPQGAMPIASLAASAAGTVMQMQQQQAMADYNAAVARNNAIAQRQQAEAQANRLEMEASDAQARGREEARQARLEKAQNIASQRAAFAASGVDVGSGTPVGVLQDTAESGERDALQIKNNAAREAWGLRTDAQDALYEAEVASTQAEQDARAAEFRGRSQAIGTLLSGASRTAGNYVRFRNAGVFG